MKNEQMAEIKCEVFTKKSRREQYDENVSQCLIGLKMIIDHFKSIGISKIVKIQLIENVRQHEVKPKWINIDNQESQLLRTYITEYIASISIETEVECYMYEFRYCPTREERIKLSVFVKNEMDKIMEAFYS